MAEVADKWKDYQILDLDDKEKLERWGDVILARPDPQVIFSGRRNKALWDSAHARYVRSTSGGGSWEYNVVVPKRWVIGYGDLRFYVSPTNFKHTGLFPEQAVNWDFFSKKIREAQRQIKVLNLFAYTGAATLACAAAGASVCHVDAAKGMGMNNRQILFQVELPNAMQVILTGFRISMVICIGTAALAFLIGAGGLGEHIFMGIDLMRTDKLLAGAIPTILLALLADYLCEILGLALVPKGLRLEQS